MDIASASAAKEVVVPNNGKCSVCVRVFFFRPRVHINLGCIFDFGHHLCMRIGHLNIMNGIESVGIAAMES